MGFVSLSVGIASSYLLILHCSETSCPMVLVSLPGNRFLWTKAVSTLLRSVHYFHCQLRKLSWKRPVPAGFPTVISVSNFVASDAVRYTVIHSSFQATFLWWLSGVDQPKHQLYLITAHGVRVLLKFPEVLDFQKFCFLKHGIASSWKQGCFSSGSQLLCSSWDEPQIHLWIGRAHV